MSSESEIYGRLKNLTEILGLSVQEGSYINGETAAYARALALINDRFSLYLKELFPQTAEQAGLSLYLNLMNIRWNGDLSACRESILQRFSETYGGFSQTDFEETLERITEGRVQYTAVDGTLVFNGVTEIDAVLLQELGEFIEQYAAPMFPVMLSGGGCSFDVWESAAADWNQLDGMNCPFSVLDTVGS